MKHLGKLKHLHHETKEIEKRVDEAFEGIDSELWLDSGLVTQKKGTR